MKPTLSSYRSVVQCLFISNGIHSTCLCLFNVVLPLLFPVYFQPFNCSHIFRKTGLSFISLLSSIYEESPGLFSLLIITRASTKCSRGRKRFYKFTPNAAFVHRRNLRRAKIEEFSKFDAADQRFEILMARIILEAGRLDALYHCF